MSSNSTTSDFKTSLTLSSPPSSWSDPLKALWWEAKGDWDMAHNLSQSASSAAGDRVHAFLHRVEGDDANAGYWYARAGEPPFQGTFEEERSFLLQRFLPQENPL